MSTPQTPARAPALANIVLHLAAVAMIGLSIYQWLELIEVRNGKTPACAVNETINCAAVWNSPFAHKVHDTFGFPVAGLGVWWGVVALVLAFLRANRESAGADTTSFAAAVKFWAIAGLLSCVTFITASVQARALCLTCVVTYGLTVTYAFAALKLLPGPPVPPLKELVPGIGWAFVLMAPIFFGLLYPGIKTPRGDNPLLNHLTSNPQDPNDITALIQSLPRRDQEMTAWAREQWMVSIPKDTSPFKPHALQGAPDAKVKIVEFTDIKCGHCASFESLMHEIERMAKGKNMYSLEPRYYPLDKECNPDMKHTAGDGVRCYGARLQICTESHPNFFKLRAELFENQANLDQGLMLAIAKRHGVDTDAMVACMKDPSTDARLKEDLEYARLHNIQGTPLVLLNGKTAPPAPAFILGMVLSGGNADAPYFLTLPPPPRE